MTIEQANEYFSSLPEGFAPAEELRAALTADVQKVQFVGVAGTAGTEAALAERLTEKARYHFDAVFCPTLAEAVEQAKANSRRGLLVCGSEAIALEAEKLLENR